MANNRGEDVKERYPIGKPYSTDSWWVAPTNFEPDVMGNKAPDSVYIHEVTLRDGEQTLGVAFKEDERIRIAEALSEIGIQRIEVGMPLVSDSIFRATKRLVEMGLDAKIVPQARAEMHDIKYTMETGADAIIIVHTINPYHCQYAFDLSPEGLIERLVETLSYAKEQGLQTTFMAADTFRTPLPYMLEVYETVAREAKPDSMSLTDTVGVATPFAVRWVTERVKEVAPGIDLEFHGHNDFGMATACALGAVLGGATGIQASFNGLGERTGNIPTEEIVAALEIQAGIKTGIDLDGLGQVAQLVANISQVPIIPGKAITGENLFKMEAEIVAFISDKLEKAGIGNAMLPYKPEVFGHEGISYVLGKRSGLVAIESALERLGLGLTATEEQKKEMLELVKSESRLQKAVVSDQQFRSMAQRVLGAE